MQADLISALGGGSGVALTVYLFVRKGLITTGKCDGCKEVLETKINTLKETTDIKLASGERQFTEIKTSMEQSNQNMLDLTGSVNRLIGKHERVLDEIKEKGNGEGKG